MSLTRTTLRIDKNLKQIAEKRAIDEGSTLQAIFNQALEDYLKRAAKREVKIMFHGHNLGAPTDKLTRSDYYPDPEKYVG